MKPVDANKELLFLRVYVAFCQQIRNVAVMQTPKCISLQVMGKFIVRS